ncbi:MAG: L,D-transpeptidase family protein [Gemmatimonadota bacterium]
MTLQVPTLVRALLSAVSLASPLSASAQTNPAERASVLENALMRYRSLAEQAPWPVVPDGAHLEPGGRAARVTLLRRRLQAEGYAVGTAGGEPDLYDPVLEAAVRRFQELHDLEADGSVGAGTLAALNVPARARVDQLEANLEPRRSFPDSLGERYILMNAAAFRLDVIEGGASVLQLRVIVGRPRLPTPIASSLVTELLFRPLWRVPRSIAINEIVPIIRRDPGYPARMGMRVFHGSERAGSEVDPRTIDWSATGRALPYRFVQEPGPRNPLGGVKLVFRTPYDVYLHDTPARALFERRRRAFSHGCVRVDRIDQLVAYLLPGWPADSIAAAMANGRDRRVPLAAPIPIHLVYWTAWVEADGLVAFREDIYHRDRRKAPRA